MSRLGESEVNNFFEGNSAQFIESKNIFPHFSITILMFNYINLTMAEALDDEVFEITDKNFGKVSENLGKVNLKFVCFVLFRQ